MIRRLIRFGWLALIGLLVAGVTGYFVVSGSDEIPGHLLSSLLAFGCLSLVFLCTLLYLLGMARLVRRTVTANEVDRSFEDRHRALRRRGRRWALAGLGAVVAVSLTGYPTHLGRWDPQVHHVLFYASLVVSGLSLWRLGPVVRREEELVRELDAAVSDGTGDSISPGTVG